MGLNIFRPYLLLLIPVVLGLTLLVFWKKGSRGLKGRVGVALRSGGIVCLCLAIAGTSVVWRSKDVQLLVLADRSKSMENVADEQERLIREIEKALPKNYSLAVVSFGENALIEKKFDSEAFGRFQQLLETAATDFEHAVRFGATYFGQDATKQMLILTDGQDNQGDVGQVSALLDAQDIRVDAWLYETKAEGDAQVSKVDVAQTVYQNEKFDIVVDIESQVEKQAVLFLYSGSNVLSQETVNLQKGKNTFVFQDLATDKGLVSYRAVLQESGGVAQNNQKSTVARVLGAPNILLVAGAQDEGAEYEKMLAATGLSAETVLAQAFPNTIGGLQKYEAVVFANVNADDLTAEQVGALDQYVKTLGKGFALLGGDNSYALGGYIGSDLEKILPLESNVRNKLDVPSLAMVIAIDHSGSMSESGMGLTRLDLAKEAAQRAVEELTDQDEVGIIAFDDTAKWIAELQSAGNMDEINEAIGGLQLGGGTMMYSSIDYAYKALTDSDAAIKHLILLTDGQPADSGFENIVGNMREDGITVSSVAMGRDANVGLMERISEIGGGRMYHVDSTDNIPAIFAKETQLSTQSYLQNRTFYPEYVMTSPLTDEFRDGLPKLTGFLATIAKPTAQVALQSDNGLPILAQWQYGAGQVVAWTSDTQGIWSEDYLSWARGAAFFSGFVSAVLKEDTGQGYLALEEQGGEGKISFQVQGKDHAQTKAKVVAPDGSEFEVPLHLEQPGAFGGSFSADQEGVYAVQVEQSENGEVINRVEGGMPRGYSAEYDIRVDQDQQALRYLMRVGEGAYIDDVTALFENPLSQVTRQVDLTGLLVLLGLLLVFLDIACRRLQWEAAAEKRLAKWRGMKVTRKQADRQASANPKVIVRQSKMKQKKARQQEDREEAAAFGSALLDQRNKKK